LDCYSSKIKLWKKPLGLDLHLKPEFDIFNSTPEEITQDFYLISLYNVLEANKSDIDVKSSVQALKNALIFDPSNTDAALLFVRKCDRYRMNKIEQLLPVLKHMYSKYQLFCPFELINEMICFLHRIGCPNYGKTIDKLVSFLNRRISADSRDEENAEEEPEDKKRKQSERETIPFNRSPKMIKIFDE